MTEETSSSSGPSTRNRVVGRLMNGTVARAPWLWPLMRGRVRGFFDERAADWEERTGAGSAEHLAPLGAALLKVSPAPERALEIGTGTGAGALLIAREFPHARVRGIDLSERMVKRAQHRIGLDPEGRVAFRVADASDLPWDAGSFDLVAEINVPPFFAEIARVLRPGGFVAHSSSLGSQTPFFTSDAVLKSGFAKRGIEEVASGSAGEGTWWLGTKRSGG